MTAHKSHIGVYGCTAQPDCGQDQCKPGSRHATTSVFHAPIRHILTGYDHRLFLAGLLVVVRRWRDVIKTITAFTVAHSITLALATTRVVNAPRGIVEMLIAASIVYVGLENLVRPAQRSRWKLTFGFGLIHGFLASERAESRSRPLASFNAGVELGQIAVAALIVPLFWKLRADPGRRIQFASVWSTLVVIVGRYWLIERIVSPIRFETEVLFGFPRSNVIAGEGGVVGNRVVARMSSCPASPPLREINFWVGA